MVNRKITNYTHKQEAKQEIHIGNKTFQCKECPNSRPGNYYISSILDDKFALVSGPYRHHQEALDLVSQATSIAQDLDPKATWASFGTVRMNDDYIKPGALQRWGYNLKLEKEDDTNA